MTTIDVTVSGELKLDVESLPSQALELIKSALTLVNEDRAKKLAEKIFGAWDEPEFIELYRIQQRRGGDHKLLLPRGMAAGLVNLMNSLEIGINWDDQRVSAPAAPGYYRPFEMRDYQLDAVMKLMDAEQGFYECPAGGGKGHPLDTEVPVPGGFMRWGDLKIGDLVLGSDGAQTEVTDIFDRGVLPTYKVTFSDHSEVLCDGDHLWRVSDRTKRRRKGEWRTMSTVELVASGLVCKEGWRWKIPTGFVAAHDRQDLPLDSYLVGALIANGGMTQTGTVLTTPDQQVIDRINESSGPGEVVKFKDATKCCDRYNIGGITQITRDLGMRVPSPEKRVPERYLTALRNDRQRLLWGLMDGDGLSRPGRRVGDYHTTSKGLARDVVQLVNSLGGTATIMTQDRRHEDKPIEYKVNINPSDMFTLFGTGRKRRTEGPAQTKLPIRSIVSIERVEDQPIRCITVAAKDHLYMIGRSYTITHNTITILGLFAYLQQRALIIVDKMSLLEQWIARAKDPRFLGLTDDQVGKIGDDVWEERDLTICMRQTLHARGWQTSATDWFDKWGVVYFDEAHHLSADTVSDIARQCRPKFLGGVSATPAKTETQGRIVHAMVGPIVARTTRQELYDRHVLMKPTVRAIYTGHDDVFWPTHDSEPPDHTCGVPDCRKAGTRHGHRNNYASVLKRLVEDPARNALIADEIVSKRGHVHLVASKQLKHLELLKKACVDAGWDGPVYMLRGEENAEGLSQPIAEAIEAGGHWEIYDEKVGRRKVQKMRQVSEEMPHGREAIIFSTVADEGLDIPPIDRTHIVFPMRLEAAIIQLIGRGERIADGKEDSVINDYRDRCVVFADQAQERDRVFRYIGFDVEEEHHG